MPPVYQSQRGSLREASDIEELMLQTAHHFDINMPNIYFNQLDIPKPDIHGGNHGEMTELMLAEIEKSFDGASPG